MLDIDFAKKEDEQEIREASQRDGATAVAPTHVMRKNGRIVGALSIGAVTSVFVWMKKELKNRDTRDMQQFINVAVYAHTRKYGLPGVYATFVDKPSKLNPYMVRVGYIPFGETNIYIMPLYAD